MNPQRFVYKYSNQLLGAVAGGIDSLGGKSALSLLHPRLPKLSASKSNLLLAAELGLLALVIAIKLTVHWLHYQPDRFLNLFGNMTLESHKPLKAEPAHPTSAQSLAVPLVVKNQAALKLGEAVNNKWFGRQHWWALRNLWSSESGWSPMARNVSSGACGIPQALPCSKITNQSTFGQIMWGVQYIRNRYGNPSNAWLHWRTYHWY